MGHANIIVVQNDAIQTANASESEQREYRLEVGEAILKLSLDPDFEQTADGKKRICDAPIFNHSNGVSWVDEVHPTDVRVFAWVGNCLRPIAELDERDLDIAQDIVDHQRPKPLNKHYDPDFNLAYFEKQIEKLENTGLPLRDGNKWGRWILHAESLSLRAEHGGGHYIDLGKIKDSSSMLHEVFCLCEKRWMSRGDQADLLRALDEIFNARETLFPDGRSQTIDVQSYLGNRIVSLDSSPVPKQ